MTIIKPMMHPKTKNFLGSQSNLHDETNFSLPATTRLIRVFFRNTWVIKYDAHILIYCGGGQSVVYWGYLCVHIINMIVEVRARGKTPNHCVCLRWM